jgi:hypothetical protein
MLWIAGIGLGLVQGAAAFLVATGLGALMRKQWRSGFALVGGLGLFLAYAVLLGVLAIVLDPVDIDGTAVDPSHKARILGENISELMNLSVWGMPLSGRASCGGCLCGVNGAPSSSGR